MTKPKLFLIDGSGFIFRAYHALPPLSRTDGTPVNAVLGFVNMLTKLLLDQNAHQLAVVFDAGRTNFRHELYPEYKSNRRETPPDLIPQFPLIREACSALGVPSVEREGFEADDLIATLASQGKHEGLDIVIVSSDKDLMQLVDDTTRLLDPMKNAIIGPKDVLEKFGVLPEKVCDVQALMGDSSDNIPGVPGIGPKTAAQLIRNFGSLESVLDRCHEIAQISRRQKIIDHADMALLSKKLVTLDRNVPCNINISTLIRHKPDPEKLYAFLAMQNFSSVIRRLKDWLPQNNSHLGNNQPTSSQQPSHQINFLDNSPPQQDTQLPLKNYVLIQDETSLVSWINRAIAQGYVAFDTETSNLKVERATLVGVSLALEEGQAAYIPLGHQWHDGNKILSQLPLDITLRHLRRLMEDPSVVKIGHNLKFDMHVLLQHGLTLISFEDTMVMSYVLFNARHGHGLDELAQLYCHHTTMTFKDVLNDTPPHRDFRTVSIERACAYAAEDADITLRLYNLLRPQLSRSGSLALYETCDKPICPIIAQMEHRGILIDATKLITLQEDFSKRMHELEKNIYGTAGLSFNIASPKQLGHILFEVLKCPGGKKGKTGAYSTGADILESLADQGHKLAALVLAWRHLAKLKSTYADALLEQIEPSTRRVHTSYSLASTSTGRLSSSNPNVQNIPVRTDDGRKIRSAFIAPPGYVLVSCDYSQIELRLLAHVADVPTLREAFHHGADIHAITAATVFGISSPSSVTPEQRRRAKAVNFGIIYGISAFGLARQLDISPGEAAAVIDAYKSEYPGIPEYMEQMKALAHRDGFVTSPWGRKCVIRGIHDRSPTVRSFAERQAINAPLQGGAADIIKKAMISMNHMINSTFPDSHLILQVHDELVFEVPIDHADDFGRKASACMSHVVNLNVPLVVDVTQGTSWS